jgi:hypothetical protein
MEPTTVRYTCLALQLSVYCGSCPQGADLPPPQRRQVEIFERGNYPLLPAGIGVQDCQTPNYIKFIKFRTCIALAPM